MMIKITLFIYTTQHSTEHRYNILLYIYSYYLSSLRKKYLNKGNLNKNKSYTT